MKNEEVAMFEVDDKTAMYCPHCGAKFKKKFNYYVDLEPTDFDDEEHAARIIACEVCCKPSRLSKEIACVTYRGGVYPISKEEWESKYNFMNDEVVLKA